MKKLTNRDVWHVYAGGTAAASDHNGYDAYTTIGRYMIQPVSSRHNIEQHIGYRVTFLNEKGMLPGGLWQELKGLTDVPTARKLCQEHITANNGQLVPEQLPS